MIWLLTWFKLLQLLLLATKLVINLKKIPYTNGLQRLKLPTLIIEDCV